MAQPTVLLLLSDPGLTESVTAALAAAGFAPRSLGSPDALDATGEAPAALVVDGGWPEGGAHAACHELRKGPWSGVPIASPGSFHEAPQ